MGKVMLDERLWNDTWFFSLSNEAKLLFLYLITNPNCNLIGCYELPSALIIPHLRTTENKLMDIFDELSERVIYHKGWIIIKNYQKYNPMRNPSIKKSKNKQEEQLPEEIKKLYTGSIQGVNTLDTHTKETERETERETEEKKSVRKNKPTKEKMEKICEDYNVPMSFVESKWDDIINYTQSTGKRYKDYYMTLRNWVKKDAIKLRKEQKGDKYKTIVAKDVK